MPKSKHSRKGKNRTTTRNDKRPVARSGHNDGPADYRTAQPIDQRQPRTCPYLDRVATLPKAFTPAECNQIINTALNDWKEEESKIQRDPSDGEIVQNFQQDLDYRNVTLFIPPKPDEWLFNRILGSINDFNHRKDGYNFDINGMMEPPNVMRYEASNINKHGKPGKYDWHLDVGPGPVPSMRKISYSILLNPGEYEGGELCFHIGRNEEPYPGQDKPEACGNIVIFPSYLCHRVLPITSGTRYAVVGWVHGDSFR